jgi:transposase-like protein
MARDRFDPSVDHSDNIKPARLQRVEVITGVERRRDWSTQNKLEIVAESLVDGVVVSDVARRHGISPAATLWLAGETSLGDVAVNTTPDRASSLCSSACGR